MKNNYEQYRAIKITLSKVSLGNVSRLRDQETKQRKISHHVSRGAYFATKIENFSSIELHEKNVALAENMFQENIASLLHI